MIVRTVSAFCARRARVCLSQASVSEGNMGGGGGGGGGVAYEIIAILRGSIAS